MKINVKIPFTYIGNVLYNEPIGTYTSHPIISTPGTCELKYIVSIQSKSNNNTSNEPASHCCLVIPSYDLLQSLIVTLHIRFTNFDHY